MIKITGLDKWILPAYIGNLRDYHTRINVFYGGAGSGKSYYVVQKICLKALVMSRKVLVIRKIANTLRDSIWALFINILTQLQVIRNINKSEFKIVLVNGSEIIFKGLDDPERIKSITGITDIVIEEATELTVEDFSQLNLRLRSKHPYNQIHLMFNPVSKTNWVYKYFFEKGAPQNCTIFQTTYKDNIHLPEDYVNSLEDLQNRNPAYYKIYVLGEFATLDKLVFPKFHKRLISGEEVEGLWFWCGMDFGYVNDETAITWGYYNPLNKNLYITGEYGATEMTNDVIAKKLYVLGLSKERIVADSAEPKSIAELRRLGINRIIPSVKGPDSIINGLDKMQRCKIIIDERCVKTIEEFENYTWQKDKKSGEYINRPIDTFNHYIDSIRYGLQTVIYKKKLKAEIETLLN